MPVTNTAVANINKPGKFPVIKNNIRQTIVTMKQNLASQGVFPRSQNVVSLLDRTIAEAVRKVGFIIIFRAVTFLNSRKIFRCSIRNWTVSIIYFVQFS